MSYDLAGANPCHLQSFQIGRDCLKHLYSIQDSLALRKLDKRSGVNKAAYAIAKRFGHRSDSPDLYLWSPILGPNLLFFQGDECFHVDLPGVALNYRVYVLGKQTQRTYESNILKASASPNEISVYITGGGRLPWLVNVTIDLSGPALMQFCIDTGQASGRIGVGGRLSSMVREKWGSLGVTFGNIDPSERIAYRKEPELDQSKGAREPYIYRRYINGIPSSWQEGIGWVL